MPRPLAAVLLVAATVTITGDHAPGPIPPLPGVPVLVDLAPSRSTDSELEHLVARERYVEAFDLAVGHLERASARSLDAPATLLALHRVGVVAHLSGDDRTAEEVLAAALEARKRLTPEDDAGIAETALRLGYVARYGRRLDDARDLYDEAWRRLPPGPTPLRAFAEQAEADWWRGRDPAIAISWYRRAVSTHLLADPGSFHAVDATTWLAWTLHREGRRDEASRLVSSAAAILSRLDLADHSLGATLASLRGDALALEGRPSEAAPWFERAALLSERARAGLPVGYARRARPAEGFAPLAAAAAARGEAEAAWSLTRASRGRVHEDLARLAAWSAVDPDGYAAYRRLGEELLDVGSPSRWGPALLRALRLRADLAARARSFLDRHPVPEPTVDDVRRALGEREAMIGWLYVFHGGEPSATSTPEANEIWAYVLRKRGPIGWVRLRDVRGAEAFTRLESAWRWAYGRLERAASWPHRAQVDPELEDEFRAWRRACFDSLLPSLGGVDHLVVDGASLPLELLLRDDGTYVGDLFDVSYVPSAGVFTRLTERRERIDRRPMTALLAVSGGEEAPASRAAALAGASSRIETRLLRSVFSRREVLRRSLPALPFARPEAGWIASRFPSSTVLASADGVRELAREDALGSFDVVHLIGHTLEDSAPEACAIAVADERFPDAIDVEGILYGWRLDARLVTLSACASSRAGGIAAGEPMGFAPALFAAGATAVVSSRWPVDDRATALLMDRFYEILEENPGTSASRALREARMWLRDRRDASGRRPFAHPSYWAGFMLTGVDG